jgi:hypothetical protein
MTQPRRILRCRVCNPVGGQLVEVDGTDPEYAAVDHAVDVHRDQLLHDADYLLSLVTVVE